MADPVDINEARLSKLRNAAEAAEGYAKERLGALIDLVNAEVSLARRAAFREAAEMAEAEANELFAKGSEYTYTTNTKAHTLAGFAKTLRAKAEET